MESGQLVSESVVLERERASVEDERMDQDEDVLEAGHGQDATGRCPASTTFPP